SHLYFISAHLPPPRPPSFPTRRSSDLRRPRQPPRRAADLCRRLRVPDRLHPVDLGLRHRPPRRRAMSASRRRTVTVDVGGRRSRSEEHTSELQSRSDLVCRLLLEKKNY